MQVHIEPLSDTHGSAFLTAVRRSNALHRPWVKPPSTSTAFRRYVARLDGVRCMGFVAMTERDELVGVVHVNEIVRGTFRSAYLGYYAFTPHNGRGHMSKAIAAVISLSFRKHQLHRLEANIQPANRSSIALVKRLGLRKEGFSPRYLKIAGRWRDHERWAITVEEWKSGRRKLPARPGRA